MNIKSRDIAIAHTASANITFIRKYQRSGNSVYGYARALVMVADRRYDKGNILRTHSALLQKPKRKQCTAL